MISPDVECEPEVAKTAVRRDAVSPPIPDLSVLQDRMPPWLKAPRVLALFTAVLGALFLLLNYLPVWHTDIWGHLAYGRWTWMHGALPHTEPLLPLARGMRFVDSAWLSQIAAYLAYSRGGIAALQFLYAASITAACAVLATIVFRRTRRAGVTLLGVAVFGWVNYEPLLIVRPQLAGLLCFMVLFAWLTSDRPRNWHWFAVPGLFAVWANLHGSFAVGLVLIGLLAVGRLLDIGWRTKSLRAACTDRAWWRLVLLGELAACAALLNPYGLGIYVEVFEFSRNPNLADLIEWDPLTVRMLHGQAAAVVAVALCVVYRLSRRRVRAGELLLLVVFGGMALWHSRMLVWWGCLAAYYVSLHLSSALGRLWWRRRAASPVTGKWSVVSLGLAWIAFAYTPLGLALLHGPEADPAAADAQFQRSTSKLTPVAAVKYLSGKQLTGQMFNTYEWGDYLLWTGRKDVFVASHAHLIPTEVWRDYMRIAYGSEGWRTGLDRYGVNTVLLDHQGRAALIELMRGDPEWKVGYEDNVAVVFFRNQPL